MKQYVVDNSKLRTAINNMARKKGITFSQLLESTNVISNSVVRKAEIRFEKYNGKLDFEADMFGLYAIYYADVYEEICKILCIKQDLLILQVIEKQNPPTMNDLQERIIELEAKMINVMEELHKMKGDKK